MSLPVGVTRGQRAWTAGFVVVTLVVQSLLVASGGTRVPETMLALGFAWLVAALIVWALSRRDHSPAQRWRPPLLPVYGLAVAAAVWIVWINNLAVAADVYYKQGQALESAGRRPEAIAFYAGALGLTPREDRYYLPLGQSLVEHARTRPRSAPDPALRTDVATVLALPPQRLTNLAQDQTYAAAESLFRRAIELAPANPDHYANLARFYRVWAEAGRPELLAQAAQRYEQALRLRPHSSDLFAELGQTYLAQGSHDRALGALTRSIELGYHLGQPATRVTRGDVLLSLGRPDRAAADYRLALTFDPQPFAGRGVEARLAALAQAGALDDLLPLLPVTLRPLLPDSHRNR